MILHDYAVIIATQTPNPKLPFGFKYSREEIDLRELSNQALNKLYLEAQSIEAQIQTVLISRRRHPVD